MTKEFKREYGCLMANFNTTGWSDYIKGLIDEADVYDEEGYGLELEPHITVLYGLHDEEFNFEDLKKILPPIEKLFAFKKNISIFTNDNMEYDVVKFEIESSILVELNEKIRNQFPYTSTFDYNPHMTIAYVKKGTGKKYVTENVDKYNKMIPVTYKYGFADNTNKYFK